MKKILSVIVLLMSVNTFAGSHKVVKADALKGPVVVCPAPGACGPWY